MCSVYVCSVYVCVHVCMCSVCVCSVYVCVHVCMCVVFIYFKVHVRSVGVYLCRIFVRVMCMCVVCMCVVCTCNVQVVSQCGTAFYKVCA